MKFLRNDLIGINNKTFKFLLRKKFKVEKVIEKDSEISLDDIQTILNKIQSLKARITID